MSSFRDAIHDFLRRAARARRRRLVRARLATGLAALSLLVVVALVALPFVPAAREATVVLLGAAILALAGWIVAATRTSTDPAVTAAWMRSRGDTFGGRLGDAVELSDELATDGRVATGSAQLAAAHVRSVARALAGRDPSEPARRAVPRTRERLALALALVALVALAVLPRSRALLLLGASAPGAPDVVTYGPVEVTYSYPSYLRRADRKEVGTGDLQAPIGTQVAIQVRADRPLRGGRLVVEGGGAVALEVDGPNAAGELVVLRDGSYRLELDGVTGAADPSPPRHAIRAVVDEAPVVRLFAPPSDFTLGPSEPLDVHFRATDDHGVSEVVARVAPVAPGAAPSAAGGTDGDGDEGRRIVLASLDPPRAAQGGAETLSLGRLGLGPGDEAWFWLEATDADVVSGPKRGESRRVRIAVRSEQEAEQALEMTQEVLAERLIEALAVHLVSAPSRVEADEDLVAAHWGFVERLSAALEAFPVVLEQLEASPEPDWTAWDALQDMRARLSSLARNRQRRADGLARLGRTDRLRQALAELQPDEVVELERSVLFFDMWDDRRSAVRALDEGSVLEQAAEEIARLVDEAGEEGELTPEARALVEEAMAELEGALAESAEAMRSLSRSGGQGPSPHEQAAARQRVEGAMQEIEEALAEGDTQRARELARELARSAQSFSRMAQSMADPTAPGDPELQQAVADARRELQRLRAQQADLRDRTNSVREDARANMSSEDLARIDEIFRELIALTDEAIGLEERGETELGASEPLVEYFERMEERQSLTRRVATLEDRARRGGGLQALDRDQLEELGASRDRLTELMLAELIAGDDVDLLMRAAQHSREQLGRLRQTLGERDAAGARAPARYALSRLEILAGELERAAGGRLRPHATPFRASAARTAEVLTRLEDLERQVQQAAESAMTAQQREAMGRMGAEQLGLERQARELLERLRELGADAPFLGREVGGAVGEAAGAMREATNRLAEGRAGDASEQQGEALARLEDAAQQLEGSGRSRGGRGGRQDGRRGSRFGEDVEIPDADSYRVPKEFREEILEALRETQPPVGYEEQVREYYRRLVE